MNSVKIDYILSVKANLPSIFLNRTLWATAEIAMQYGESKDYIGNLEKQNKIIEVANDY